MSGPWLGLGSRTKPPRPVVAAIGTLRSIALRLRPAPLKWPTYRASCAFLKKARTRRSALQVQALPISRDCATDARSADRRPTEPKPHRLRYSLGTFPS